MKRGFTLAELLLTLVILGVIATFTIPKVLQSQQSSRYNSVTKETIAAIVNAYEAYSRENVPTGAFKPADLTPYLNYVKFVTAAYSAFEYPPFGWSGDCDSTNPCIYLHNGAIVSLYGNTFNNTAATNGVFFLVDPDPSSSLPVGGGLDFFLYFNKRVATWATLSPNSTCSYGSYNATPANDPSWFGWS